MRGLVILMVWINSYIYAYHNKQCPYSMYAFDKKLNSKIHKKIENKTLDNTLTTKLSILFIFCVTFFSISLRG